MCNSRGAWLAALTTISIFLACTSGIVAPAHALVAVADSV